jgi:hypothetical protein
MTTTFGAFEAAEAGTVATADHENDWIKMMENETRRFN